jgi:pimeloyl-ACP methyl ester carboxylesterase
MRQLQIFVVAAALAVFFSACVAESIESGDDTANSEGTASVDKSKVAKCDATDPGVGSDGSAGYGDHFKTWMQNNGYSGLASKEGWGGKEYSSDCSAYFEPVIFIHGNADYAQGWSDVRDDFLVGNGSDVYYYPSELYAIGYGYKGVSNAAYNHHKADYMADIRSFIAAVKAYTGASQVDVIGHSLGVTMLRKAILGGTAYNTADRSGSGVNLGSSISSSIDAFVGIAGARYGLYSCGYWPFSGWTDTCGPNGLSIDNPFYSNLGSSVGGDWQGEIYSWVDEIICYGSCYYYYVHGSTLPGGDGYHAYYSAPYGHINSKEYSADYQIDMVLNHDDDGSY